MIFPSVLQINKLLAKFLPTVDSAEVLRVPSFDEISVSVLSKPVAAGDACGCNADDDVVVLSVLSVYVEPMLVSIVFVCELMI